MLGVRLLILLGCIAAAAHWVAVFAHARRDAQRRLLLMRGCGTGRCGTADETAAETGISVLCSGCDGIEQVERLLDTEYARYETVLALDAAACPELFKTLVSRYRMIRVNPACCGTIRGLYRSRQRGYRRLVIVDRTGGTSYDDFDAAAAVAAHDYLLPLPHGCRLRPDAAERLATELAAAPDGAPELIVSRLGEPIRLVGREVAAREGGFGPHTGRGVRRERRRTLYEVLAFRPGDAGGFRRRSVAACAVLLLGAAGCAATGDGWAAAVPATTALVVWAAGRATAALASEPPAHPRPAAAPHRRRRRRRLKKPAIA